MVARSRRRHSPRSWIAMALFALPFMIVGLIFLFAAIGPMLYDGWRMRSWQPVHAQLVEAELLTRNGKGGRAYGVRALYSYEIDGVQHTGRRAAIVAGTDNVTDFNLELGRRLERILQSGGRLTAYVNPERPQEAVLDRSVRWAVLGFWSLFAVGFGGAGVGLLVWSMRMYRSARGQALRRTASFSSSRLE